MPIRLVKKPSTQTKTPDQKAGGLWNSDQDLLTKKSIQTIPQGGRRQQRRDHIKNKVFHFVTFSFRLQIQPGLDRIKDGPGDGGDVCG